MGRNGLKLLLVGVGCLQLLGCSGAMLYNRAYKVSEVSDKFEGTHTVRMEPIITGKNWDGKCQNFSIPRYKVADGATSFGVDVVSKGDKKTYSLVVTLKASSWYFLQNKMTLMNGEKKIELGAGGPSSHWTYVDEVYGAMVGEAVAFEVTVDQLKQIGAGTDFKIYGESSDLIGCVSEEVATSVAKFLSSQSGPQAKNTKS